MFEWTRDHQLNGCDCEMIVWTSWKIARNRIRVKIVNSRNNFHTLSTSSRANPIIDRNRCYTQISVARIEMLFVFVCCELRYIYNVQIHLSEHRIVLRGEKWRRKNAPLLSIISERYVSVICSIRSIKIPCRPFIHTS